MHYNTEDPQAVQNFQIQNTMTILFHDHVKPQWYLRRINITVCHTFSGTVSSLTVKGLRCMYDSTALSFMVQVIFILQHKKNLRGVLGSITCTVYNDLPLGASRTSNRKESRGSLCKQWQCCCNPFSSCPSIHSDILMSVTSNFKH